MRRLKVCVAVGWRLFVGCLFCQFPLTALMVVGWTMRSMRGSALKVWWHAGAADLESLAPAEMSRWPNFVLREAPQSWRNALADLGANFKLGLLAILNIWVLTWPAGLLWYFGWRYGWDISFNKVYEHAEFGRTVSIWGIFVFLIVMLYVPVAQARQAVTGDWRAFWQWRAVVRIAWFGPYFVVLAGAYALASLPILALVAVPYLLPTFNDETLSAAELVEALNGYYFRTALIYFPLYVGLHLLGARLYAGAVLRGLRRGQLSPTLLHPAEQTALAGCGVEVAALARGPRGRAAAHVAGGLRVVVALALWFVLVATIYVAQFVNYQPMRHWFNQPLVHLPWVKYVPSHLEEALRGEND